MSSNNKNNNKRLVALTGLAAITLLVVSIAVIGVAQPSYQQQLVTRRGFITSWMIQDNSVTSNDLRDGEAVRSSDIVDGQVNTADLANGAVTTDKIRNGEVKAEDLDPSIELGGSGSSDFSLQVTERSNSVDVPEGVGGFQTISVQCNSDEVVTGGGFDTGSYQLTKVATSKKQDNGWTTTILAPGIDETITLTVYAECLKVVPATTAE